MRPRREAITFLFLTFLAVFTTVTPPVLAQADDEWVADMSSAFRSVLEDARAIDVEGLDTQARITRSLLIHQCVSMARLVETPLG